MERGAATISLAKTMLGLIHLPPKMKEQKVTITRKEKFKIQQKLSKDILKEPLKGIHPKKEN
jgi:hypothetical protein